MDMDTLLLLARDSFLAHLLFPVKTEVLWHSLHGFSAMPMMMPTLVAFVFSTLAYACCSGLGFVLRHYAPQPSAESRAYQKTHRIFTRYLQWLLLLAWVPFLPVLALILGFFRQPLWQVVVLAALGRAIYYAFYLYG